MPEYRITWQIDIMAATPLEAAQRALRIHRDSESIATVFDVTDEAGTTQRIDLEDAGAAFTACTRRSISLSKSDWAEIYYAVELKRLRVAEDNRKNGRSADGVDLAVWRRQMEHVADALGPDGERMHEALTTLIDCAAHVISRWAASDLQFAVQKLNRSLTAFGAGIWSDSVLTAGIPDGKSTTMPTRSIEIIVLYPFLEQHGANVKALDAIDAELRRLDIQTTIDAGAGLLMHRGCLLSLDAIERRPKLRNTISESGVRYFLIGADTLPLEG